MVKEPVWLICDGNFRGDCCVFSERTAAGRDRCIRHGKILSYHSAYNGMSRTQVRAAMAKDTREAATRES